MKIVKEGQMSLEATRVDEVEETRIKGAQFQRLLEIEEWLLNHGREGLGEVFEKFLNAAAPPDMPTGLITLQKVVTGQQLHRLFRIDAWYIHHKKPGLQETFQVFLDAVEPAEKLEITLKRRQQAVPAEIEEGNDTVKTEMLPF